MANSIWDFEVPPPLHKITGKSEIAPQNEILSGQDTVKIITKEQYRYAKKQLAKIEKALTHAKVDDLLAEFVRLREEHIQYKVEWLSLKKQAETGLTDDMRSQFARVRENNRLVYQDAKEVVKRLEPHRKLIGRRAGLRQRIKEYETWLEDEKINERLTREMAEEANWYAKAVRTHWKRMGFVHRYTKGRKTVVDVPTFERIIATPDTIQFKVAISRQGLIPGTAINVLPDGVMAGDLVGEKVIKELTDACERIFTTPNTDDVQTHLNGIWLYLWRNGLVDGLLDFVRYEDVIERYDSDKNSQFMLPLGVMKGRHINWIPLVKYPHILVTGQTGSGKSKAIDMILATLARNYKPTEIRFVFFDLKEGIELGKFAPLPHTIGLVNDDIKQVGVVLTQLEAERKRRMNEIRKIPGVVDVDQYNAIVPEHMRFPRIVVVFDEFSTVASNRQYKQSIYDLVTLLAQKGRSSNIHLLIGAQTPYQDIVPSPIKAQMVLTLTGRQRTLGASMSATGNKEATDLAKIAGRMLCDDGMDMYQVQMPYITPEEIKDIVANAQQYPKPAYDLPSLDDLDDTAPYPVYRPIDENRIAQIAVDEFGGVMARDKIWAYLNEGGEKVSKVAVNELINAIRQNPSITISGVIYAIKPHGKGSKLESLYDSSGESPQNDISTNELSNNEVII
jgi:hypothetical protein